MLLVQKETRESYLVMPDVAQQISELVLPVMLHAAIDHLSVERAAASAGLARLKQAGLIQVVPRPGQRPLISIVLAPLS